ncbi:MAG TPA: hypothetical protein VKX96_16085, partial [Chloroflexota bacterium]|nr:hypothetical protein [Chloroflexota bacterium]
MRIVGAILVACHSFWQEIGRSHGLLRRVVESWALAMATLSVCSMAEPAVAASIPSPNLQGYDISFPNCRDHQFPASPGYFTVIGVNGGKAYTTNPCFGEQYQWASASGQLPAVYINLNYPRDASAANGRTGPRGTCPPEDAACLAYNYGYNAAQFAVTTAHSQGVSPTNWWLDIETANYWSPNQALNAQVIQGAIDYLQSQNLHVGIYSVVSMWQTIAGSFAPGLPNWVAQTNSKLPASAFCSSAFAFGGGTVSM